MAIGADDPAFPLAGKSRRRQDGAIVALPQKFVIQMARKQLLDQLRTGATTRAMAHVDLAVFEVEGGCRFGGS